MNKIAVLRNIFLIFLLIGVIFMVTHFAEPVKNMAFGTFQIEDNRVLGASSKRAEEITGKVGSDIAEQFANVQKQAMEITLGDVVVVLSRVQKIPQDIHSVHDFVKEQAENVLQSSN